MKSLKILGSLIGIYLILGCNAQDFEYLQVVGKIKGDMDVSAISCLNSQKCLIASDELTFLQFVSFQDKKLMAHEKFIELGDFKHENDIEGLTNDGKYFYAVSSHSLNRKKDKYYPERFKVFKILIDDNGNLEELIVSSLEPILAMNDILKSYLRVSTKNNGIDIEGLAYKNNKLYFGFRSPVLDEHAQILEVGIDFFNSPANKVSTKNYRVHTSANEGIRGMEFLGDELGIITGLSNQSGKSMEARFIRYSIQKNSVINTSSVPQPTLKLEAFEQLTNRRVFLYDSEQSGMPVQLKNN